MVKVIGYRQNVNNEGKQFVSLELQGGVELVSSKSTGKIYATVRKTFMSCTFDSQTAEALVGTSLPGSIEKVQCDPYEHTLAVSNETVVLDHRFEYVPEGSMKSVMNKEVVVRDEELVDEGEPSI